MTATKSMKDLLSDEIKDLYSAEKQLTKAIPKMAAGSQDAGLKQALLNHLKETQNQVNRLEKASHFLKIIPSGKKCQGMEGVIKEGAEALKRTGDGNLLDLGIIGAGTRVEHYEIAGYQTAMALANRVGALDVVELLRESLVEEEAAEKTLRKLASGLMQAATGNAG